MKLNNNDDSHNSGLNLLIYNMLLDIESHPAWVCGLKLSRLLVVLALSSHTLRGCVDWNPHEVIFVGWKRSHPAWVCGLKPYQAVKLLWSLRSHPAWVCGLKRELYPIDQPVLSSHPAWVCGLKQKNEENPFMKQGHTLRGCVDWNSE